MLRWPHLAALLLATGAAASWLPLELDTLRPPDPKAWRDAALALALHPELDDWPALQRLIARLPALIVGCAALSALVRRLPAGRRSWIICACPLILQLLLEARPEAAGAGALFLAQLQLSKLLNKPDRRSYLRSILAVTLSATLGAAPHHALLIASIGVTVALAGFVQVSAHRLSLRVWVGGLLTLAAASWPLIAPCDFFPSLCPGNAAATGATPFARLGVALFYGLAPLSLNMGAARRLGRTLLQRSQRTALFWPAVLLLGLPLDAAASDSGLGLAQGFGWAYVLMRLRWRVDSAPRWVLFGILTAVFCRDALVEPGIWLRPLGTTGGQGDTTLVVIASLGWIVLSVGWVTLQHHSQGARRLLGALIAASIATQLAAHQELASEQAPLAALREARAQAQRRPLAWAASWPLDAAAADARNLDLRDSAEAAALWLRRYASGIIVAHEDQLSVIDQQVRGTVRRCNAQGDCTQAAELRARRLGETPWLTLETVAQGLSLANDNPYAAARRAYREAPQRGPQLRIGDTLALAGLTLGEGSQPEPLKLASRQTLTLYLKRIGKADGVLRAQLYLDGKAHPLTRQKIAIDAHGVERWDLADGYALPIRFRLPARPPKAAPCLWLGFSDELGPMPLSAQRTADAPHLRESRLRIACAASTKP